jgi:hypothetical protein
METMSASQSAICVIVKVQEQCGPGVDWKPCPYIDSAILMSTPCTTHFFPVAGDKALGSHALAATIRFGKLHATSQESQEFSELERATNQFEWAGLLRS